MNKSEREELRRLLRARFKLLRSDVAARSAELELELSEQIKARHAQRDREYDDAMFRLQQVVDEANRAANDIGRDIHGKEVWGVKADRTVISCTGIGKAGVRERAQAQTSGQKEINNRVRSALLELERQENELLTELATSALESAEAREFFARIPSVSELVPAYRLKELGP